MNGSQAAAFYQARQREALGLIESYEKLETQLLSNLETLNQQVGSARLALARAYLKDLSTAGMARVQGLTGFLGFERRNPNQAMAHEKHTLEHTVSRISEEANYQQRQELASEDGTLSTRLIEVRELLAPYQTECERFEVHEGFMELVQAGYDTPGFVSKWWQATYWKQWAAGDRICKALGYGDFGDDVLPKFLAANEQRNFWRAEEAKLNQEIEAIHELVRTHDQALARIPQLPAIYLDQSQNYLAEYLDQADPSLLEGWLTEHGGDRSVLVSLRTLAGLKAKQAFIAELRTEGIAKTINDLRQRTSKYARKTEKFLRSKHYYRNISDRELDRKFASKVPKYQENENKLRRMVDRMMTYDDYSAFSLDNDPALWWAEFTGKGPPRYLPQTRRWYERNSRWSIQHDNDKDDDDNLNDDAKDRVINRAVADAAMSRDLDDVGYLS